MPSLLQSSLLRLALRHPQSLEIREKAWRKEDLPLVKEDQVRDHLSKLDTHRSMGPDRVHPGVLRELADITAKPLSIIFERSWRTGELLEDWRKANVTPICKKDSKEDPGNYRLISLHSWKGDGTAHSGCHL